MKELLTSAVLVCFGLSDFACAYTVGVIDTDRFGYTGLIVQYATLEDAQAGVNPIAQRPITTSDGVNNRDLCVEIMNGFEGYNPDYTDFNNLLNSWWYTTGENLNGLPKDDPDGDRYYSGWGNFRGNSGMFMQFHDWDSSTDTNLDMSFQNFDGTYWTEFKLSITGSGPYYSTNYANPYDEGDLARCRIQDGTTLLSDPGTYHEYSLTLTAGGLQGQESATTPNLIEAFNHPESVSGNYSGLFENNVVGSISNKYFWTFDLELNMVNWAYEQGDEALNGDFKDSYFAVVVPEPTTMCLILLGGGGLLLRKRLKQRTGARGRL